jgi:poly-gamma-glutamate synthesis protein (capsule biosynthesis protein)
MIFVGDIALPDSASIDYTEAREVFGGKSIVGNLEGSLTKFSSTREHHVFNSLNSIEKLCSDFNFKAFSIANNHILDVNDISDTFANIQHLDLKLFGAGENLFKAQRSIFLQEDGSRIYFLGFGWEANSCKPSSEDKQGVNPYRRDNVLYCLDVLKQSITKDDKIVIYFHWNYELELYPQPFDREFSRELIEKGVDVILGAHAHRCQGIEYYNNKPIIYGLGNWLFPQEIFWDNKLKFPDFTLTQMAVEIDFNDLSNLEIHWFQLDRKKSKLNFIGSQKFSSSEKIRKLTPFSGISNKQYIKWFSRNRFQKKLLPIFKYKDSILTVKLKLLWISLRHCTIVLLLKLGLK